MSTPLILTLVAIAPMFMFFMYRKPIIGVGLLLATPLFKTIVESHVAFLEGYAFDLSMAASALLCGVINWRKKRRGLYELQPGKKIVIYLFYAILLLAVVSYSWSRAEYASYLKIVILGVYIHLIVYILVLYFRDRNDIRDFNRMVMGLALLSGFIILIFPVELETEVTRAGAQFTRVVMGANPLTPTMFLSAAAIWLWANFVGEGRWPWLVALIPLCLLAILSIGVRAPLFFLPLVFLAMAVTIGKKKLFVIKSGALFIGGILAYFLLAYSGIAGQGRDRLGKLQLSTDEHRFQHAFESIDGWLGRDDVLVYFLGGGIGDSSFSMWNDDWIGYYTYPHNWLLEILVESGPLGLLVLGYFFYLIIKGTFKTTGTGLYSLPVNSAIDILAIRYMGIYCIMNSMKTGSYATDATAWIFLVVSFLATQGSFQPQRVYR